MPPPSVYWSPPSLSFDYHASATLLFLYPPAHLMRSNPSMPHESNSQDVVSREVFYKYTSAVSHLLSIFYSLHTPKRQHEQGQQRTSDEHQTELLATTSSNKNNIKPTHSRRYKKTNDHPTNSSLRLSLTSSLQLRHRQHHASSPPPCWSREQLDKLTILAWRTLFLLLATL